jgi:hypothetical protein
MMKKINTHFTARAFLTVQEIKCVLFSSGSHNKMSDCGLNNRNIFSHSFEEWKTKFKVLAGLVSNESSLSGLYMATFSLSPHVAFSMCIDRGRDRVSSSSHEDNSL